MQWKNPISVYMRGRETNNCGCDRFSTLNWPLSCLSGITPVSFWNWLGVKTKLNLLVKMKPWGGRKRGAIGFNICHGQRK